MHDDPYLDKPIGWVRPGWAATLCNLYWRLRAVRRHDSAGRRKWYRYIRDERDFLVSNGVDAELVRLACRYYSNPVEGPALDRLEAFEQVVLKLHAIQGNAALHELARRDVQSFFPDLPPEFRVPRRRMDAA